MAHIPSHLGAIGTIRQRQKAQNVSTLTGRLEAGFGEEENLDRLKTGEDIGFFGVNPVSRTRPRPPPPPPSRVDPSVIAARRVALSRRRRLSQGRAQTEGLLSLLGSDAGGARGSLLGV